jgi:adenylate kinase
MKLVILGPQASGKGTQANMIAEELDIPHISTGDIFRKNIKEQTELGKEALKYINDGKLVPDEVTNKIIKDRLNERDCEEGFILDGFPRNTAQAGVLDNFTQIAKVIEIQVSDEEAIKRITGRRTCEKCGAVFSIYQEDDAAINNVCKKCGGKLVIRKDDTKEAITKRLEIYHNETEPLVDYYKEKKILLKINGERPIEIIFKEIINKLK